MNETRLFTLSGWAKDKGWPSRNALRALINRGHENGFHTCVRRVAGRVLIDERSFFEWVEAQNTQASTVRKERTNG